MTQPANEATESPRTEAANTAPSPASRLRDVRWGLALSLLTIFFGFTLGGLFGAAEDTMKGRLQANADAVLDRVYGGDVTKAKPVVDKSWSYLKRAHLHGGAIGSVALASSLLLAALRRPRRQIRAVTAGALGASGLAYAAFWLLAGFRAPSLGSTGAAKESLAWIGFPSAGLLLAGLAAVLVFVCLDLFTPADSAPRTDA